MAVCGSRERNALRSTAMAMSEEKKFGWLIVGILAVLVLAVVLQRGLSSRTGGTSAARVIEETAPRAPEKGPKFEKRVRPPHTAAMKAAAAAAAKKVAATHSAPAPKRGELGDPSRRKVVEPPPAIPRHIREEMDPAKRATLVAKHRIEIARAKLAISRRRVRLLKATISREKATGSSGASIDTDRQNALGVELKTAEAAAASADIMLGKLLSPDAGMAASGEEN